MTGQTKRRGSYGRPCDLCATRRVRCVFDNEADRCRVCVNHNVQCTQHRIRRKTGPKSKARGSSSSESNGAFRAPTETVATPNNAQFPEPTEIMTLTNPYSFLMDPYCARIPLDKLISNLQIYQTWFYGYWPMLSVAEIILKVTSSNVMSQHTTSIRLDENNAFYYSLACSVCAAIATQMTFVSTKDRIFSADATFLGSEYADEAKRVRSLFDYTSHPNVETLLSSFFLYAHYTNVQGKTSQAIVYLREAISISQLLSFHDPKTYAKKSAIEGHRWRKIYYTLLVTERFVCFEDAMPVILDPCIDLPLLENEEYPSLLAGFIELAKVFSVPDKHFFEEIHRKDDQQRMQAFRDYIENQEGLNKRRYILEVQTKLRQPLDSLKNASDSQKLNIILSRSWIQAIAWHIAFENGLMTKKPEFEVDCFTREFPISIATDFLGATKDLPAVAFEANGPGVCVKLLEIANSLTFAKPYPDNPTLLAECLNTLFKLVNQFKNHITLPLDVYNKVAAKLSSLYNTVDRPMSLECGPVAANIQELLDDEDNDSSSDLAPPGDLITSTMSSPKETPFTALFRQLESGDVVHQKAVMCSDPQPTEVETKGETGTFAKHQWSCASPSFASFMHPP